MCNGNAANYVLGDNERLDDLQYKGLRLIQRVDKYCFTSDAVALANTVKGCKGKILADLGAGSGVVAILAHVKQSAKLTYAVELQPYMLDLLERNVTLNGLDGQIEVVASPMQEAYSIIGRESCDVVMSNPPYSKLCDREIQGDTEIAACRHELTVTLDEVVDSASKLLKFGGMFYVIYKAERLSELICSLNSHSMPPKEIICLAVKDGVVDTVIVVAKKGAKQGLRLRIGDRYNET